MTQAVPPGQCSVPKLQGKPKATSLHLRWGEYSVYMLIVKSFGVNCRNFPEKLYRSYGELWSLHFNNHINLTRL